MVFPSIEFFKEIIKKRSDPGFWAENIIESERLAKTPQELKHFYAYITNPHTYNYEKVEKTHETLGDLESRGELPPPDPADERMTADVYKNGCEYKIFVRNNTVKEDVDEENDEKRPQ